MNWKDSYISGYSGNPVSGKIQGKKFNINPRGFTNCFFSKEKTTIPKIQPPTILLEESIVCPDCKETKIVENLSRGDKICKSCGTVVLEHTTVNTGETAYDHVDVKRKIHDEPLTYGSRILIIVKRNGNPDLARRAKSNNRIPWEKRKLLIANAQISKLKPYLPITEHLEKITMKEVQKAFKTNILQGRNVKATTLALLYWACLESNSSIGFDDILEYGGEEYSAVRNAIRKLSEHPDLNIKFKPKQNYGNYFSRIGNELKLPQYVSTDALKIFRKVKESKKAKGDPRGWIGASFYISSQNNSESEELNKRTQVEISKKVNMTEMTIRKKMQNILDWGIASLKK